MAWIRLDDQIAHHPKFVKVGPEAAWLWVCGQSYCARYLTDGYIPQAALPSLGNVPNICQAAERLVWAGLWESADDGWLVHDYHDYQPTRETVEHLRQLRRNAGKIGGKTAGKGRPKQDDRQSAKQDVRQTSGKDEAKLSPVPVPVPDPVKEEEQATTPTGALARSSRARAGALVERSNPRIQNPGDPMPLWDWQASKFRDALRPKFGDEAYAEVQRWMHRVGDELIASGDAVDVSDPVRWWDTRYGIDWGPPTMTTMRTAGNAAVAARFKARRMS